MAQTWIEKGQLTRAPTRAPTASKYPTPSPTSAPVPIVKVTCPLGKYFYMDEKERASAGCRECGTGRFGLFGSDTTLTSATFALYSRGTVSTATTTMSSGEKGGHFCTACPMGKYQQIGGQSSCVACPAGKLSPRPAANACGTCHPGEVAAAAAATKCAPCARGKYMSGYMSGMLGEWAPSAASVHSVLDLCNVWLALTYCLHFVHLDPIY
jgi:hypothetical protein